MKLEEYGLEKDPFPIVPDGAVYNWAGREELRDDLLDVVKGVRARDIGVTEFVVLHGELGSGKSHTLRFLKTAIEHDKDEFDSVAIYLERPRVANKLNFLELQRYIVRELGRNRLEGCCQRVKDLVDETVSELAEGAGLGHVADKSSFLEDAIERLPSHDRDMVRLLRRGASDGAEVYEFLVGNRACGGKEYEGKVDSDFMAAKVLSDLFRVATSEIRPEERVWESVYLFLDEGEVLFDAKSAESEVVFSGLRELINGLPYRFGLFVTFTAATALIEAVMPQHLLKRMTLPYIEIPALEDGEAKEFLRTQLDFSRVEGSEYNGTHYPFSEEAIGYIVEHTTSMTPRHLFIDCKRVLERAIRREQVAAGEEITEEMAARILQGYR